MFHVFGCPVRYPGNRVIFVYPVVSRVSEYLRGSVEIASPSLQHI